jgi:hypothetical protein
MELDHVAPLARLPPVIAKPTYSPPSKNLWVARYITTKLAGLKSEEFREKQARLQELLSSAELQQEAMGPTGEASSSRRDRDPPTAGPSKPHAQQASSPSQSRGEQSRSNRALGKNGGNHRTQQSGYHNRQPRDLDAVTSKPRNLPRLNAAEPAQSNAAARAAPAPAAGQGAQGHQPARSHVSQRVRERVDPPKDDARHRLNLLAESKLDEEESSVVSVYFGPHIRNEPFTMKFTLLRDMPKYTRATKPKDWLSVQHRRRHRKRQQEAGSTLCPAHAPRLRKDFA